MSGVACAGVVLLALAARAVAAIQEDTIFNDGPRFIAIAEAFGRGDFWIAVRDDFHPLTSALIAIVQLTGVGPETAGKLISVASGGLSAGAIYWLASQMFSPRLGLVAGLLAAAHPRLIAISSSVQSDGLYVLLALLAAAAGWSALKSHRLAPALASGALCGLAYLTRPEGIVVAVVVGAWLGWDALRRNLPWRRAGAVAAAFAVALLAFAGPYVIGMRVELGEWMLSQKKSVTEMVRFESNLPPAEAGAGARVERVGAAFEEVARDAVRAVHPLFLLLALFGLRRGAPGRETRYLASYALLFLPILVALHLESDYVSRRHWLLAVALFMPYPARGLLAVADFARDRVDRLRGPRGLRQLWTPATVAAVVVGLLAHTLAPEVTEVKSARKDAALWLGAHVPGSAVAAPRERLGYYAGAERFITLPHVGEGDEGADGPGAQELVDRMRAEGADFIVTEIERLGGVPVASLRSVTERHRVPYDEGFVVVLQLDVDVGAPAPPGDRED